MSRRRKFVAATLISFTFLFSFVAAQNHPQMPIRNVPLSVFDAKGKRVGKVLDLIGGGQGAILAFEVDGRPFVLNAFPDRMERDILFFESTDCSGTPFLQPIDRSFFPPTAVLPPGSTVYLPDPIGTPRTITARSELGPGAGLVSPSVFPAILIPLPLPEQSPAVPVIDLNTVFTPPFSIRATK